MESNELTVVQICHDHGECNELALVLAAQAIPTSVRRDGRAWVLSVPPDSVSQARLELEAYRTEKRLTRNSAPGIVARGQPWPGIAIYSAALMLMALIAPNMGFGIDWLAHGRMDGEGLRAGEWWRPVTALTLHADAAHLLGNVFFGSFFAYSVSRYFGGGFGWLAIVLTGAVGNLVNGLLSGADHRSIGASTAVFAALGILSAYLWRRGFPSHASRRERMAPLIAGVGLLAFTGAGGINTDVGAHLFGFLAGFAGGLLAARAGLPERREAQLMAAAAAPAIVALAWSAALVLA